MFSQIVRSLLLPRRDLPGGAVVKNPPNNAGDAVMWVQSLAQKYPLE